MPDSEYLSLGYHQVSLDRLMVDGGTHYDVGPNVEDLFCCTSEHISRYMQEERGFKRIVTVQLVDLPDYTTQIDMLELYVKMPIGNPFLVFGTKFFNRLGYVVCNPPPEVKEYRAQVFVESPNMDCEQDILDFVWHSAEDIRRQYSASHGRKIDFTPLEEMILTKLV